MPSGILNSKAKCLIGRNVAIKLQSLTLEMADLDKKGISYKNLIIDENASLTMPWHILRDGLRESMRHEKIGTTKNGAGPTYADRTERVGLLVKDLISEDFKQKLEEETQTQNKFFDLKLNPSVIFKTYQEHAKKIKPLIGRTIPYLKDSIKRGKNVLFEGAHGWLLDIDAGTYPYVTSSNPGIVGIARSF